MCRLLSQVFLVNCCYSTEKKWVNTAGGWLYLCRTRLSIDMLFWSRKLTRQPTIFWFMQMRWRFQNNYIPRWRNYHRNLYHWEWEILVTEILAHWREVLSFLSMKLTFLFLPSWNFTKLYLKCDERSLLLSVLFVSKRDAGISVV